MSIQFAISCRACASDSEPPLQALAVDRPLTVGRRDQPVEFGFAMVLETLTFGIGLRGDLEAL